MTEITPEQKEKIAEILKRGKPFTKTDVERCIELTSLVGIPGRD